MNTIAFCAPFVLVIACALLLIREDHRERRELHDALTDRPRMGLHTSSTRTLNGAAVPPPRSVERPCDHERDQQDARR